MIDDVRPNPDVARLSALYNRFWQSPEACDAIVAVGGGSAIDTAKALMVGTASGRFDELVGLLGYRQALAPTSVKPLIAVPTTAGTGSEVTPWATIWDAARQKKYSLHLDATWPEAAIVDPELMLSVPAGTTVSTGLDALSHALESVWNVNANPSPTPSPSPPCRTSSNACRRCGPISATSNCASAWRWPRSRPALAFSNTKTALAHSISYEMTLRYGLAHGIACSFTLPIVLEKAWARSPDRDRTLQRLFGPDLAARCPALARLSPGTRREDRVRGLRRGGQRSRGR